MIKSKQLVESLRNTAIVLLDKFTQILNTSICTVCSNLWCNEIKNGSYQLLIPTSHYLKKGSLVKIATCCHFSSFNVTGCHSLYHLLPFVVTHCHLLYHSLPFVVTHCHSLSLLVPLVVTSCFTRCNSLSFFVTRCTIRCHSLSLDIPLVCPFINDRLCQ